MILNHYITKTPEVTPFLVHKADSRLEDSHIGGIDIQDASQGLNYQIWTIYYENNRIKIKSSRNNKRYDLLEMPGVKEVSLSFNLNMDLNYSFTVDEVSYLRFFDAQIQDYSTIIIPDSRNVRLTYDDNRDFMSGSSDTICAYINKNSLKLCYRLSRDRYTKEYELAQVKSNTRLTRVGMSTGYRLQFKMVDI